MARSKVKSYKWVKVIEGEKMKREEIRKILSRIKEKVEKLEGVERVILYGSYARNEADEHSDINILIVVKEWGDTKK